VETDTEMSEFAHCGDPLPLDALGAGVAVEAAGVVASTDGVGFADSGAGAGDDDVLGEAATSDVASPRPKISHLSASNVARIATTTRARRSQ
jgi:hypothetical protein